MVDVWQQAVARDVSFFSLSNPHGSSMHFLRESSFLLVQVFDQLLRTSVCHANMSSQISMQFIEIEVKGIW